jgi:hypothetical protein
MSNLLIGTSAYPNADDNLLKGAGIGWIRQDFSFPFLDRHGGALSQDYQKQKETAASWVKRGFQVMGVTPLFGIGLQKPDPAGQLRTSWNEWSPAYLGKPGSLQFEQGYARLCEFLAEDLHGRVSGWQILNEQDIAIFAGPVNPRQAGDLILASAYALKKSDPALIVGTNTAGSDKAYFLYGYLHASRDAPLDYCGVDGYYGTWSPGGPENWAGRIAELFDLTRTKVLVNEWGYASAGGLLSEEERRLNPYVCQQKKWYYAWDAGHTPEVQAKFVQQVYEGLASQRDKLFGAFFYRWEDQAACWQCGAPDCPAETAWGLVTAGNQPKPAYFAFQDGVQKLVSAA